MNKAIHACFNKIKVKEKRVKEASQLDKLISEKRDILKKKTITKMILKESRALKRTYRMNVRIKSLRS